VEWVQQALASLAWALARAVITIVGRRFSVWARRQAPVQNLKYDHDLDIRLGDQVARVDFSALMAPEI
jgi:hypothetical protein